MNRELNALIPYVLLKNCELLALNDVLESLMPLALLKKRELLIEEGERANNPHC